MTTPVTKKVSQLALIGNIQAGDVIVGERNPGTTVRMTYVSTTVADGEKGDITVASGGTVWTIDTPLLTVVAADDKVLIKDTSASNVMKYVTAQAIADLAVGGVTSVNTKTGAVVLTSDDISDTTQTHKFTTAADASRLASTSGTNTGDQTNISGNAATVTTNANLTGVVTSVGNATSIAAGAISNTMLANGAVANLSGTNTGDQTITLTGDVTGSGSGSFAATIANSAVTLAKQANMATASVVYRKTAGSGAPEVNTLATLKTDLGLTGTNSGDQTITLTGDVTGSGSGSFAATIANSAVTLAKQANMATNSLVYRKTAGAGAPEINTLATVKTDLGLTGTNSGDQTSIVGITGTKAQFNTAVTDGDIVYTDSLGTNVATFLATPTSANLAAALTDETGSGAAVFATSPTFTTPVLGTPTSGTLSNCTGLPVAGGGTGIATTTAYSVICAGTTATGAFQSLAALGSSGNVLTSNGAGALPSMQNSPGRFLNRQILTSGTTYTKTAGANTIVVEVIGAGGGGGGSTGGAGTLSIAAPGGGGGYANLLITSASATYTYAIGQGGAGGVAGNNAGSAGGTTTFNSSSLQATGGGGGAGQAAISTNSSIFGGVAGVGSNGNINLNGKNGQTSVVLSAVTGLVGSPGGNHWCPDFTPTAIGAGPAGLNYGGGGCGGFSTTTSFAGGTGANGAIIITEYS